MIHILADRDIFRIGEVTHPDLKFSFFNSADGLPKENSADVLFVRTVTRIDAQSVLNYPNLTDVATASAGFDHLDLAFLDKLAIRWHHAPGCNARSVAEWVTTAIFHGLDFQLTPDDIVVGIVGVGQTGNQVYQLLTRLGFQTVLFDPPRQQREPTFRSADFKALFSCDILTVHIPLTPQNFHFIGSDVLFARPKKLVLNAARGGIVDEQSLLEAKRRGFVQRFSLDVWENEPDFNEESLKESYLATPHIAGYSQKAKTAATTQALRSVLEALEIAPDGLKIPKMSDVEIRISADTIENLFSKIHPASGVDRRMREIPSTPKEVKNKYFGSLRNTLNDRVEWTKMTLRTNNSDVAQLASILGLSVIS